MPTSSEREQRLFALALAKAAGERAAFLRRECAGDDALLRRVELLVAARERRKLSSPSAGDDRPTAPMEPAEAPDATGGNPILPPAGSPLDRGSLVGGRYTLILKIGEGGMGSVWRARQEIIGRDVALKMIHPELVTPALQGRFIGEMELLGQLNHPGIVRIFDAGMNELPNRRPIPFFAMELVEGEPLDRWAAAHRGDRVAQLRLATAICAAVRSAHERRIIHRDLKPGNILVRPDGQPAVLDFGIARLAGLSEGDEAGSFSGTPQYAAPEQHLGRDQDFRSGESVDVYALGAILFEMLAGRRLFEFPRGAALSEMRRSVLEDPLPRVSDFARDCPVFLEEIVSRATRRDPADRYFSMAALGRALDKAVELLIPGSAAGGLWQPSPGALVPGTSWRLAAKIGEGGAGQVWTGVHDQLGERRVFKFCDTEDKARTLKRELTLFRLLKDRVGRNPHFVRLHEVSLDEPPWYLMMDALEARDLTEWWPGPGGGSGKGGEELALEIIAQTAEALQAAHEAGILHRDIKPANLLIQTIDSPPGVHVFVADFGVGQIVAEELLRTGTRLGFTQTVRDLQTNRLSGTLLYLAPEVLEGNPATARSDLYSLGIILWQLLAGNLHAALDPADWARRIPDPLLREDLDRCLAGSPEKRWSSAGELAESLRRLPERRAAAARRQAELAAREQAAYRRGVLRATGLAAVLIALFAGLAWLAWSKSREAALSQTKGALEELTTLADAKSGDARNRLVSQMPRLDVHGARLESEFRNVAARILAMPVFTPLEAPPIHPGATGRFSEDGERMVRVSSMGGAEMVDFSTGPPAIRKLPGWNGSGSSLRVNLSGYGAGAIDADGGLRLWSGANLSKNSLIPGPHYSGCFALSPFKLSQACEIAVAVARPGGAVEISLLGETNPPLTILRRSSPTSDQFPETRPASMLAFSLVQEGILAASGPESGNLLFWKINDHKDKTLAGSLAGAAWHPDNITCLCWSPVADEIATACRDGILRIWRFRVTTNVPQTEPVSRAELNGPVRELAWSFDGGLIAALFESGSIRVLQAKAPDQPPVAILSWPGADHLAFVASRRLVAWGKTGARAWGSQEPSYFEERRVSAGGLRVDFHREGCLIASGIDRVHFLNPSTLARIEGFTAQSPYPHPALIEGTNLVFPSQNGWFSAPITKVSGKPPFLRLSRNAGLLNGVKLVVASPRGVRAAWLDDAGLHSGAPEREEGVPAKMSETPELVATSDAAALAAWAYKSGPVHLHDYRTGKEGIVQPGGLPLGLAFSPEQDLLACRNEIGVTFINPATLDQVPSPLAAPGSMLSPVSFSPDGRWIAVGGRDNDLVVAAVPSGPKRWRNHGVVLRGTFSQATVLRAPTPRRVISLRWNVEGSRLACGTEDSFAQTWNVSLLRRKLRQWKIDWGSDTPPVEQDFVPLRFN